MKRYISIILCIMMIAALLCACTGVPVINIPAQPAETDAPAPPAPAPTAAPTPDPTEAPTEAPTEVPVGPLSSYIRTAKEKTIDFSGQTYTMRLPEILIESADAQNANYEIMNKYGSIVNTDTGYIGVINLDYEAYLNDSILSVVITAKYDGGNTYGMAINFDVLTGSSLNNTVLCSYTGRDYSAVESKLLTELTKAYDERWLNMRGNEKMRAKTFADENIKASELYLNENGSMMALVRTFAAVGGGEFLMQIAID